MRFARGGDEKIFNGAGLLVQHCRKRDGLLIFIEPHLADLKNARAGLVDGEIGFEIGCFKQCLSWFGWDLINTLL